MPRITVSTCGVSILTNVNKPDQNFIYKHSNSQITNYSPEDLEHTAKIIDNCRAAIKNSDRAAAVSLSAEIHGLMRYYEREVAFGDIDEDTHYLIHTDTFEGEEAAKLVDELGRRHGIKFILQKVDDLRTDNIELFRFGVNNLISWCHDMLSNNFPHTKVIFNLVGGFKALQGYMQTLGMFYADETIYIFERSQELLSIPKLPLSLDTLIEQVKGIILKHIQVFRKIDVFRRNLSISECEGIPETLLTIIDGECDLSVWGNLIWNNLKSLKEEIYREKLLEPLHRNIKYSDGMKRTAEGLDGVHTEWLNSKIDLLARYLDSGRKFNTSALDYKKLRTPQGISTHEFDLWNEDHTRAFCHEEGGVIVIDKIGPSTL